MRVATQPKMRSRLLNGLAVVAARNSISETAVSSSLSSLGRSEVYIVHNHVDNRKTLVYATA